MKLRQSPELASAAAPPPASARGLFLETVLVALIGLIFGFSANKLSPRGLVLDRDYFPPPPKAAAGADFSALAPARQMAAELKAQGLRAIDLSQARQLFNLARLSNHAVIFLDARGEREYAAGHIPLAWEFDPYQPEKFFPLVLPVCQAAKQIVVYCHGGDCDDSVSAARLLRDVGVPNAKLLIFTGGMAEWTAHGLPVETGGHPGGAVRPAEK